MIRDGKRIRVHAQLIRASNDEHFWSETYDRELGDVLALESDVAQSIAEKVRVTVSGEEQALLGSRRKIAPEAFESYLKGAYASLNTRVRFSSFKERSFSAHEADGLIDCSTACAKR